MTDWSDMARRTIAEVHASLPPEIPFSARKAAIDAAYPFGERRYWPYKAWLKARRAYLRGYDPAPRRRSLPPGGLFRWGQP